MRLNKLVKGEFEREGYRLIGRHSAVKICNWTKNALRNKGGCYKEKFYGIDSHRCCQMSCTLTNCQNNCLHCWRNLNYTDYNRVKNPDLPSKIIDLCIKEQQKILQGFKGNKKTRLNKFNEAMNPSQFAISLTGEGTLYPYIGELISELRKRKITSFLVTNGLNPEVLEKLQKKKQLPTQLYLSVNAPNKELFNKIVRSKLKNAWKIYLKTINLFPKLKTRKVIRLTLIKDLNMNNIEGYADLIKIAKPDFVECKSYMAVGFSRQRLGYEKMPWHSEIREFSKQLAKLTDLKILDEKKESCVVLLGKTKKNMRIKTP